VANLEKKKVELTKDVEFYREAIENQIKSLSDETLKTLKFAFIGGISLYIIFRIYRGLSGSENARTSSRLGKVLGELFTRNLRKYLLLFLLYILKDRLNSFLQDLENEEQNTQIDK
jgi:hypothetical protein